MKIHRVLPVLLLLAVSPCFGQPVDCDKINELKLAFASRSSRELANHIDYPLKRRYPLSDILNPADFMRNYAEIVDNALLDRLADSDPVQDWEYVGWHGIQNKTGEIRLSDDYLINSIGYETKRGKAKWDALVKQQRKGLPAAYRDFDVPVYEWPTDGGYYRIDRTGDAYRLMIWSADRKKLIRVYENGTQLYEGNMGDFHIDWIDGEHVVRVQNYGFDGELLYHFFVYNGEELMDKENPNAIEAAVEKK